MTVYDASVRERAADLFGRGLGRDAAARLLGIPVEAVRKWHLTYRAVGRDGLLSMGTNRRYDYDTKVAAAATPPPLESSSMRAISPVSTSYVRTPIWTPEGVRVFFRGPPLKKSGTSGQSRCTTFMN